MFPNSECDKPFSQSKSGNREEKREGIEKKQTEKMNKKVRTKFTLKSCLCFQFIEIKFEK